MSAVCNVIEFPSERATDSATVRRRQLQAWCSGGPEPCGLTAETAVMAWLLALPAQRCRRRAALAMRAQLAATRSAPACQGGASPETISGDDLRRRQVLAFLGALSRSRCTCSSCSTCSATPTAVTIPVATDSSC